MRKEEISGKFTLLLWGVFLIPEIEYYRDMILRDQLMVEKIMIHIQMLLKKI